MNMSSRRRSCKTTTERSCSNSCKIPLCVQDAYRQISLCVRNDKGNAKLNMSCGIPEYSNIKMCMSSRIPASGGVRDLIRKHKSPPFLRNDENLFYLHSNQLE